MIHNTSTTFFVTPSLFHPDPTGSISVLNPHHHLCPTTTAPFSSCSHGLSSGFSSSSRSPHHRLSSLFFQASRFLTARETSEMSLFKQRRRVQNEGIKHSVSGAGIMMTGTGMRDDIDLLVPGLVQSVLLAAKEAGKAIIKMRGEPVEKTKFNQKDLVTKADVECQNIIERIIQERHPGHFLLGEENVPPGPEASAAAVCSAMSQHDFIWVVDPIDGTINFVMDMPLSAVSIAVAHKGEVIVGAVYEPRGDELFHAVRGHGAFLNGNPIHVSHIETEIGDAVVATGSPPNPKSMAPTLRGISAMMAKVRTLRMIGSAAVMMAWVACGRLTAYWEPDLNSWDMAAGYLIIDEAGGKVTDLRGNPYSLAMRPLLCSNSHTHKQILDILIESDVKGLDP